ncbi:MAG: hypothetical protein H8E44_47375 [Planctomycetes bacterium]|nr:hypothetical protein [Planctomycetota bacterium]MBL7041507.1 hypothetical protein [Pirellulaceae bacterium]
MAFQFQCPQCANVLQAEESQAGEQSQCPLCQTLFIIPAPIAPAPASPFPGPAAAAPAAPAGPQAPFPGVVDTSPTAPGGPQAPFPGVGGTGGGGGGAPAAFEMKEPELLHIPCPECKETLETPVEMLDQDVMCPHCEAQFRLRRRDSVEFKRKKEQLEKIKEHKVGKAWFNWAIIVVVLVLIFLLFLIFSSGSG